MINVLVWRYKLDLFSHVRTAPSAWSPSRAHQDTRALALAASLGPSRWDAWHSVVTSTTSSASSRCTTTATRMAAYSVPPARLSMGSRRATSPPARWSTMSSPTHCPDILTAKPSGSYTISLLASRYSKDINVSGTSAAESSTKEILMFLSLLFLGIMFLGPRTPKSRQTFHRSWVSQTLLPPWQWEGPQGKKKKKTSRLFIDTSSTCEISSFLISSLRSWGCFW